VANFFVPVSRYYIISSKSQLGSISNLPKNCSGLAKPVRSTNVSLPRDLIGSETLPLPIYKNEMLPST
jgi:hypothetical protein